MKLFRIILLISSTYSLIIQLLLLSQILTNNKKLLEHKNKSQREFNLKWLGRSGR